MVLAGDPQGLPTGQGALVELWDGSPLENPMPRQTCALRCPSATAIDHAPGGLRVVTVSVVPWLLGYVPKLLPNGPARAVFELGRRAGAGVCEGGHDGLR